MEQVKEEAKEKEEVRSPSAAHDYEEQSFRSVASIRLSQRIEQPGALPPYKREQLPEIGGAAGGSSSKVGAEDDLTYERLGRQFRDLTAKVIFKIGFRF
jgi:hypothetical protein